MIHEELAELTQELVQVRGYCEPSWTQILICSCKALRRLFESFTADAEPWVDSN